MTTSPTLLPEVTLFVIQHELAARVRQAEADALANRVWRSARRDRMTGRRRPPGPQAMRSFTRWPRKRRRAHALATSTST